MHLNVFCGIMRQNDATQTVKRFLGCTLCAVLNDLESDQRQAQCLPTMQSSKSYQHHMCAPISGSTRHMPECARVMLSLCHSTHCPLSNSVHSCSPGVRWGGCVWVYAQYIYLYIFIYLFKLMYVQYFTSLYCAAVWVKVTNYSSVWSPVCLCRRNLTRPCYWNCRSSVFVLPCYTPLAAGQWNILPSVAFPPVMMGS